MDSIEERLDAADTVARYNETTEATDPGAFVLVDGAIFYRGEDQDGTMVFDGDPDDMPEAAPDWSIAVHDPDA